jgi:hypothetical protein
LPPIPRSIFDESDTSGEEREVQELLERYDVEPLSDSVEVAGSTATKCRKFIED